MKINENTWDKVNDRNTSCFSSRKYNYLREFDAGKWAVHLCKEVSTDLNGVMFVAKRTFANDKVLPVTKGFEVRFDFYNNLPSDEVAIVIKLRGNEYSAAFTYLIDDIFNGFNALQADKDVVDYFFNRLDVWKTFFDRADSKGLSDTYRRGLFAELYFIKNALFPHYGAKCIKFWTGPEAGIHDFELGKIAVEVKSSAGNKSTKIKISNERQLDDSGYDLLLLFQVSLSVRKNHQPTLVDMVKEVATLFHSDHGRLVQFKNFLLMAGYHPMHEELYLTEGYHVDETNVYKVSQGFPRIIGSQVPSGVGGIKYSVDLSACSQFKIDAAAAEASIKTGSK
ncbi:MAG: PD-(D/E)XK motif protein [Bdellovibrionales bacterium]|nr:PD-(D/E)XK motif protein [Bdellovibrionales bacterium]